MRKLLAILLGKTIHKLTRTFKAGGGSAAPGLYALKIYPNLVDDLAKQIPKHVVITGTNGKTTTARMLAHFAKAYDLKVIRNNTGSNLERGIASTLIQHYSLLTTYYSPSLAIWELDEAAFNLVASKIKPDIIVFLNVFRDQLDRYGEVDTVVKKWCETLKKFSTKTQIFLNGDDENIVKLSSCFGGKVQKFGLQDFKIPGEHGEVFLRKLDIEATNIKVHGLSGSSFQLTINNEPLTVNFPLPGIYHIYDFLAAFACGLKVGIPPKLMVSSLKDYTPAFGRVERFSLQPSRLQRNDGYIFLIKNPAGTTEVFKTLAPHLKRGDKLLVALNDNLADGTDVSWIWDANFELLQNSSSERKSRDYQIICSGIRAEDLALRLKYAGFDSKSLIVENNLKKALEEAKTGLNGQLFILPTYTALLDLQKILAIKGIKQYYWKQQ